MNKQLIISIGREFGSGGHEIAQKLSQIYSLPLYDRNLLDEIAASHHLDANPLKDFDETNRNKLLSRTVRGFNNSPAYNVASLQFDFLKQKAAAGESFVVVGRCADFILKDTKGLISLFILGEKECKLERIMSLYRLSHSEAEKLASEKDRKRKNYYNSYCEGKWGDSRNYDLSINSSLLPLEDTLQVLKTYIDTRIKQP